MSVTPYNRLHPSFFFFLIFVTETLLHVSSLRLCYTYCFLRHMKERSMKSRDCYAMTYYSWVLTFFLYIWVDFNLQRSGILLLIIIGRKVNYQRSFQPTCCCKCWRLCWNDFGSGSTWEWNRRWFFSLYSVFLV